MLWILFNRGGSRGQEIKLSVRCIIKSYQTKSCNVNSVGVLTLYWFLFRYRKQKSDRSPCIEHVFWKIYRKLSKTADLCKITDFEFSHHVDSEVWISTSSYTALYFVTLEGFCSNGKRWASQSLAEITLEQDVGSALPYFTVEWIWQEI
jgi:hypothetical protein